MEKSYLEKTINNFIATEVFGPIPTQILNALLLSENNDWNDFHSLNNNCLYKQYFFVSRFLAEKLIIHGEKGIWLFETNIAIWGRNKTDDELKLIDDDIFYKIILNVNR